MKRKQPQLVPGISNETVRIVQEMDRFATSYAAQRAHDRLMQARASLKGKKDDRSRRDYFLTFCREATADERAEYAKIARKAELHVTRKLHVLVENPDNIPSLYGANAVNVLVHRSSGLAVDDLPKTFHGRCGHSTFAFASTGEVIG